MALLLLLISQGRTPGGHGLLEAVPRIYQVTPDIPGRRRATKQEQVRPQIWPTASKRVSSPPVGTIPSASDITDDPNHNSKSPSSSAASYVRLLAALPVSRASSRPWGRPFVAMELVGGTFGRLAF